MFQGCMYRPTNEIKIETKNKTEIKQWNLINSMTDIKTLISSYSKAKNTRIKQKELELNLHFRS